MILCLSLKHGNQRTIFSEERTKRQIVYPNL